MAYASETYVRQEVKALHNSLHDLANDLVGDIRHLHNEIEELREQVNIPQSEVERLSSGS